MNFYIIFLLFNLVMCAFSKNIITKSGLDKPISCSVGLKFFATVNNTSGEDCNVEVHPDECCLDAHDEKCNVIEIIGSAAEIIPEGTSKRLELVAPLLDLYDRRGYCTIYVDCKSKTRPKNFIRDTIKIKFDTTLHPSNLPDDGKICKHIDEDPMNECKPVHCDTYYNGKKPYFNILKKQCVVAPSCLGNVNTEIPKTAYNPTSNKCIHKPAISNDDINFIKALTKGRDRRAKDRKTKDVLIIKMIEMNSTASNDIDGSKFNTISRITGVTTKKASEKTNEMHKYKTLHFVTKKTDKIHTIVQYLTHNKYTLIVLSCVILLQCCLICTLVYCLTKNCRCFKKKKDIEKIFNYRQDASVTTPLICTSNIDTETTEYQYLSESSNYIDKKIKCYKACQKERKNNIKLSMSDDILSKCLTRRDWRRLPRSETIPEVRNDDECKINEKKESPEHKKTIDAKVNFQDEIRDKKSKAIKSIVKKTDKACVEPLSDSSEKLIRCHSYNYDSNMTCFKNNTHSKTFGLYQEKKTDSTEQGAQAYFSNDSIDDFLSERGVIFIGDNASKYSFTSMSSAAKSSVSSQSSKTSKNNVVKNVMSMLSRKPKGPSSDPGQKSKQDLDLELLHISRASVCSSSNDTDPCKDLKRIKDSTSSL